MVGVSKDSGMGVIKDLGKGVSKDLGMGVGKDLGTGVGKDSGMVELVKTRAWCMSVSHLISWHHKESVKAFMT